MFQRSFPARPVLKILFKSLVCEPVLESAVKLHQLNYIPNYTSRARARARLSLASANRIYLKARDNSASIAIIWAPNLFHDSR